jgi:hypothetical protein
LPPAPSVDSAHLSLVHSPRDGRFRGRFGNSRQVPASPSPDLGMSGPLSGQPAQHGAGEVRLGAVALSARARTGVGDGGRSRLAVAGRTVAYPARRRFYQHIHTPPGGAHDDGGGAVVRAASRGRGGPGREPRWRTGWGRGRRRRPSDGAGAQCADTNRGLNGDDGSRSGTGNSPAPSSECAGRAQCASGHQPSPRGQPPTHRPTTTGHAGRAQCASGHQPSPRGQPPTHRPTTTGTHRPTSTTDNAVDRTKWSRPTAVNARTAQREGSVNRRYAGCAEPKLKLG